MARKYSIGDKVVVRKDLKRGDRYYMEDSDISDTIIERMVEFASEIVTIKGFDFGKYLIEENCDRWTDDMFEGLFEEDVEDGGVEVVEEVETLKSNYINMRLVDFVVDILEIDLHLHQVVMLEMFEELKERGEK